MAAAAKTHCLLLTLLQDDIRSFSQFESSPASSSKSEESAITPPEAWGGERLSERLSNLRQPLNYPSRFGMPTSSSLTSGSLFSGLQELSTSTSQPSMSALTDANLIYANIRNKDFSTNQETKAGTSESIPLRTLSLPLGMKADVGQTNPESPRASLNLPRRFSTYAERISTASSFTDGMTFSGSPKVKKTGAESREELLPSLLQRSDLLGASESRILPTINVYVADHFKIIHLV